MKKCFFVTAIGDEQSDIRKRSDKVLKNILEPVLSDEFDVIRVDKLNLPDNLNQTIIQYLEESELVIVDMTDSNPNVFYEFGYRHASKKALIPIKFKDSDPIPFDVSSLRTIFYSFDIDDVNQAKDRLEETVKAFNFEDDDADNQPSSDTSLENIQLLKIQDKLDVILKEVTHRNDAEIEQTAALISKYSTPQKTPEAALMEQIFPMLLSDPEKIDDNLAALQKISQLGEK